MTRASILAAVLTLATSPAVAAYFVDGNMLHEVCRTNPAQAEAYVAGAVDGLLVAELICVPAIASTQARDVACRYLTDHPESRHLSAALLIREAVRGAWAC